MVLTVSQIYWCKELTQCLSGDHDRLAALDEFLQENFRRLNNLAAIVRKEIPAIHRAILGALTPFFLARTHFCTTNLGIWLPLLQSLCSPGNQHAAALSEKYLFFNFFIKKGRNRHSKFDNQKYISLIIILFVNNYNL
mgnify:CR=1 FL=1